MKETETGRGVGEQEIWPSSLQQEWVEPWADIVVELFQLMGDEEEGGYSSWPLCVFFYALGGLTDDKL